MPRPKMSGGRAQRARAVRKTVGKYQGRRSRGDVVLGQGTGRVPRRAFGSTRAIGLEGWDAFSPKHIPLPRSTGPYTVVRTTRLVKSSAKVNIIGTYAQHGPSGGKDYWTNIGMLTSVSGTTAINASSNTALKDVPFPGVTVTGSGLSAVPAAISVQVMNPNALQSTNGIIAGAVSSTQLDLRGRAETWNEFATEFISFMRPRLMSAGKLALRGVQLDSYPLDMSALADFRAVLKAADAQFTWDSANRGCFSGWAPLVIINDAANDLELDFLITIEWRVRFDIGNPAVASHSHHGVTSDSQWDRMIKAASNRGNGVMDIVEKVANVGSDVANMASAAGPLVRRLPALMG